MGGGDLSLKTGHNSHFKTTIPSEPTEYLDILNRNILNIYDTQSPMDYKTRFVE